MRLLQLNPNGSEDSALDFHPMVTVVTGLGPNGRELVLRAVAALPSGSDPGCGGLVEAHGIMLDLTPDTLAMLDLAADDLDVLVRRADLPTGNGQAASGSAGGAREPASRAAIESFIETTPEGRFPELDAARRRRNEAREALAILREAVERTRAGYEDARARRERVEAALTQARAELEGGAPPSVGMAVQGDAALRRAELEEQIRRLQGELERIERGLEELSSIDTRPIQVLLDAIRDPGPVEYVPSERAAELADEFERLQAEVAVLEEALEARGLGPASGMQRLEEARAELDAAERAMAKPELSPEDVAELEAAHEEVLEAERKASRFGKRGQKRLEEALARQQEILDRVGFPTWSAYVMGASLLAIDPIAEQRLERARFELEAAEAHWADITAMIEADPAHRALLDRLEEVYLEAYDLLGGEEPEDLATALRELKVPKREITIEELVDALAYQLELVGLALPPEQVTVDYVTVVADAFLAEAAGINERIEELRGERRAVEAELARCTEELELLDATTPSGEVIDLTDDLGAPEPVGPASVELAELEAELAAAAEDERDHLEALEAREALVDAATQVEAVATTRLMKLAADLMGSEERSGSGEGGQRAGSSVSDLDFDVSAVGADDGSAVPEAIEFYLLSRLAALRNISYAGSVPLVIDDALSGLPPEAVRSLLGKLERMAESVQVIYLSDDPVVVDWANEVGFQRAAVVSAPPAFA
ncbi:MAG: hypothetical protein WHS89_00410 [Acidimicrobiales bacterium]